MAASSSSRNVDERTRSCSSLGPVLGAKVLLMLLRLRGLRSITSIASRDPDQVAAEGMCLSLVTAHYACYAGSHMPDVTTRSCGAGISVSTL